MSDTPGSHRYDAALDARRPATGTLVGLFAR